LKEEEIWQWLIWEDEKKAGRDRGYFETALKMLRENKSCRGVNDYYFLPGRNGLVRVREQRELLSGPKTRQARKVAKILALIPWVGLIGITGSLARKNCDEDGDIDLFFITRKGRLWLTRGLVVIILRLLGLYRRPGKITDMICPNMFVSEDALEMKQKNLFIAHEVCLMTPIFDRDNVYQEFLDDNQWVKNFLPNVLERTNVTFPQSRLQVGGFFVFNYAEWLARQIQLWYMRKHRTTEEVSENLIKFHPQNAQEWVLEKYKKHLEKLSLFS
jgi:predicted nucleotidyltransferase